MSLPNKLCSNIKIINNNNNNNKDLNMDSNTTFSFTKSKPNRQAPLNNKSTSCDTSCPNSFVTQKKTKTSSKTTHQQRCTCDLKSKFCIYLIFLLGAIVVRTSHAIPTPTSGARLILHTEHYREQRHQLLLQEKRSLVLPTPRRHHLRHRSIVNMQPLSQRNEEEPNSDTEIRTYCAELKDSVITLLKQAQVTYSNIYTTFPSYTDAMYNVEPRQFYQDWRMHKLELNHPYANYIEHTRNYNDEPVELNKAHLEALKSHNKLTVEKLKDEFILIHQTLKSIQNVYNSTSEERQRHRNIVLNGHVNEISHKNTINKFLTNISNDLQQDLHHVVHITGEKVPLPKISYNKNVQQLEGKIIQEHMSVMKYLIALYTFILNGCAPE